jgi:hypothetical protein
MDGRCRRVAESLDIETDREDANGLCRVLEEEIVPSYTIATCMAFPVWVDRMRNALRVAATASPRTAWCKGTPSATTRPRCEGRTSMTIPLA